jgi:hypothetical protein
MLAMRPVGVATCILGMVYGLILAKILQLSPTTLATGNLADPGLPAALTLLISSALLAAWLFYFNADVVRRLGFAYAERLFECLPSLPSAVPRKRTTKASNQATGGSA